MSLRKKLISISAAVLLLGSAVTAHASGKVIGQNEFLLTAMNVPGARAAECTLGNAAADALRSYAETDIALIPGGVFAFNLMGGDVTEEDVALIFPGNDPLVTATISPAVLWDMLEQSVSALTLDETDSVDWENSLSDGFLQVSGLRFRFDVSNFPGERVTEVLLDDGTELDPNDSAAMITVSSTEEFFSDSGVEARDGLEYSLPEMFIRYLESLDEPLRASELGRIDMYGSEDSAFLRDKSSSAVTFLLCAGVIALVGSLTFGRSIAWKALKERAMPETEEEKNSAIDRFL